MAFFVGQIEKDKRNPNSSKNMLLLLTLIAKMLCLQFEFLNIKESQVRQKCVTPYIINDKDAF